MHSSVMDSSCCYFRHVEFSYQFKLGIVVALVVWYDLERIATLESLPECSLFHLKHVDF